MLYSEGPLWAKKEKAMNTTEIESLISRVREYRKEASIGRKRINATPEIRSICLKIVKQIGVLKAAEKTGFSILPVAKVLA